jgi:hypothetical protein
MSQKKFSTFVLVLSVTCAFLVGIIGGYLGANMMLFWRFASFPMRSMVSNDSNENEHSTRKDILFYNPGNDNLWNTNYKQIPAGKGEIKGMSILIESTNNRSIQDDYLKLEKEFGSEEAR